MTLRQRIPAVLATCLLLVPLTVMAAPPAKVGVGDTAPADIPDDIDALLRAAAADDAKNAAAARSGTTPADQSSGSGLRGFAHFELARAVDNPSHWSKMLTRVEFGTQGKSSSGIKWKISARVDYDAVFDATNFYSDEVRRDQRFNFNLRETYFDTGLGNWDLRIGRQHVVWGEMVGLFFADVVSARDMREFILPEFNILRIPQWAARAEYFKGDFKGELLWVPVPSYDETGKPGAEFFPAQPEFPGYTVSYRNEQRPSRRLSSGNYGLRGTWLADGWDLSAFFYRSMDAAPTFYRQVVAVPQPQLIYTARHDRISQTGGTLAKGFGVTVLKAEAVYTTGRSQTVLRLTDADGVVPQNTLDWALGLDVTLPADTRLNLQYFQSMITNHDSGVIPLKRENGYSLLLNRKLTPRLEAEVLWVASFERTDWMLRPKINWDFERNWRLAVGADVFKGPPMGFFGRYATQDRVYTELRYSY
ncbi:MAG: hypothetical protein Q8J96_04210 [Rhodocyclaceae bacterium]|nr:hypothetical protein [Rhodocyclaceae bacterium]